MLPRNMMVPVVLLAAGWYGGAKYGAPEYLMTGVDDMVARGGAVVGGLLGNEDGGNGDGDNGAGDN